VEKKVRSLNLVSATTSVLIVGLGTALLTVYGLSGIGYAWILAYGIMSHEQIGRFERRHELDLAFQIDGVARFRANV
jgi:Tfp pilus assembly ATPase PilU